MHPLTILSCFVCVLLLSFSASSRDSVRVVIHSMDGYSERHQQLAMDAAQLLETVLNSDTFRTRLLAAGFTHNRGYSNQKIYSLILRAHELDGPGGTDGVIDLRLRAISRQTDGGKWMRKCRCGTIGKHGGNTGIMATCPTKLRDWSDTNDVARMAGHLMHEYLHMLNFHHPEPGKRQSVVYLVGYLVRELGHAHLAQQATIRNDQPWQLKKHRHIRLPTQMVQVRIRHATVAGKSLLESVQVTVSFPKQVPSRTDVAAAQLPAALTGK